MQSPCVTFLDMDIYQQARNEFPPLRCVVLVWLSCQQLAYIYPGGGGEQCQETRNRAEKTSGICLFYPITTTTTLLNLLKLLPKTSRFRRIHNVPTHEGLRNLSSKWAQQLTLQMGVIFAADHGNYTYSHKKKSLRIHVCCSESPCTFHKLIWTFSQQWDETATISDFLHSQFINDDKWCQNRLYLPSPYPKHIPPHAILPVLHISLHCLAQQQESPHQCKYDVKNTRQQPALLHLLCRLRSEHNKYGCISDGKTQGRYLSI
jgi:hypothetical protein